MSWSIDYLFQNKVSSKYYCPAQWDNICGEKRGGIQALRWETHAEGLFSCQ